MALTENLSLIRERLAAAAQRSGREAADIELMGVSKTVSPERIRHAYQAGVRMFGESRVQEFSSKLGALSDLTEARWHMIGHLQSNKAARAVELFSSLDSVDSLRLAQKLNACAHELARPITVLIEVNVGGEDAKSGADPDSPAFEELLQSAPALPYLDFRGLMTVPPFCQDPQRTRPFFQALRELRDRIAARGLARIRMEVLSMGMSHDFEVAVEEGSTRVRIGTALFGERGPH
jgi:pyridoxal phosphate enzyme (YggS family)